MSISDHVACPDCGEWMSYSALWWHPFNCEPEEDSNVDQ